MISCTDFNKGRFRKLNQARFCGLVVVLVVVVFLGDLRWLFSDAYLLSVLDQPASSSTKQSQKQMGSVQKRTFEYSLEKLVAILRWRRTFRCDEIPSTMADMRRRGGPEAETLLDIVTKESYLNWHGYDRSGRPVLWVRPKRKDWTRQEVRTDLEYHALMFDLGIRMMPPGVTQMLLVGDADGMGPQHADLTRMQGLIDMLRIGYPDRLGNVVVLPAPLFARAAWTFMQKLAPASLVKKLQIVSAVRGRELLQEYLGERGLEELLPPNLGGKREHTEANDVDLMVRVMHQKMERTSSHAYL